MRSRRNSSSADSGSSSSSTRGLVISARASATRCCWPPDSCGRHAVRELLELHPRQHLRGLGAALGLTDAAHLEIEGDVVEHAQMREQRIALEHHRRAALDRRHADDHLAADPDLARGRRFVAGDHAQDRRLAAAADGPSRQQ